MVDFYSAGDTPASWELNMWNLTLSCGFTTRLSGETDFSCMFDERVGMARSWSRQAVDQCWKMKQANIRPQERLTAETTYNEARKIYYSIIQESSDR